MVPISTISFYYYFVLVVDAFVSLFPRYQLQPSFNIQCVFSAAGDALVHSLLLFVQVLKYMYEIAADGFEPQPVLSPRRHCCQDFLRRPQVIRYSHPYTQKQQMHPHNNMISNLSTETARSRLFYGHIRWMRAGTAHACVTGVAFLKNTIGFVFLRWPVQLI
jgi:hypothetical protein